MPRGTFDYLTTDDDILALRWKDNKVFTMLSNDLGIEPVSSCSRYSKETKKKEAVACPKVIKSYNANMGGIDKSDMLVHLYRTPMKSKRWYMRLFAYSLDLTLCNAWLLYRRDCSALGQTKTLPLKEFRLEVFKSTRNCQNPAIHRVTRSVVTSPGRSSSGSSSPGNLATSSPGRIDTDSSRSSQAPRSARGQRSQAPQKLQ